MKNELRQFIYSTVFLLSVHPIYSNQLVIDFYGQRLEIEYNENILSKKKLWTNEVSLKDFHNTVSKSDYHSLLESLQTYRTLFNLNDWLYYSLIDKVCGLIDKRVTNIQYLKWFLLGKSGYRTIVTFSRGHVLVYVESNEHVTGLRKYNNSYCLNCGLLDVPTHNVPRFNPFKRGKSQFSFFFNPLPTFPNKVFVSKVFRLRLPDSSIKEVEVKFDSVLISCLYDFPGFSIHQTFSVPLSQRTRPLLQEIAEIVKDYNDSMKVEYITSFVRKNSLYVTDQENFGREKWMTPEEYLYYGSGDCEDRCSFLYYALREVLKKPLVVIHYPQVPHVNIGISLELKSPPNFYYNNRPYYVCEPTVDRGFIPLGKSNFIKKVKYEIRGEYIP